MDEDNSVIFGLDYQARSMTTQQTESDKARFLVGTQSLKQCNQVYVLEFDEDTNQITRQTYQHIAGEIWNIAAYPSADKNMFATCYAAVLDGKCHPGCAIWSPVDAVDRWGGAPLELNLIAEVDASDMTNISCFHWQPMPTPNLALLLCDSQLVIYDTQTAALNEVSRIPIESKTGHKSIMAKWNSHHKCQSITVAQESCLRGFDIRSKDQTFLIENAHVPLVRDLDFNPNRQYILATAGDDCKAKFWDIRSPKKPLGVVGRHSHWVWNVRYNPVHDQLLLTCSSDSRCILHCVQSLSSDANIIADSPSLEPEEEQNQEQNWKEEQLVDGVIKTNEEHEDSVYCCEWSATDPWVFASLSYDGRVVINKVPTSVKYKILQL